MWAAPQVPDSIPALSVPVIVLGLLPIAVFPRRGFFVEKRRELFFKKPMVHKRGFQRTKKKNVDFRDKNVEIRGFPNTGKERVDTNVEIRGFQSERGNQRLSEIFLSKIRSGFWCLEVLSDLEVRLPKVGTGLGARHL